MAHPPRVPVAAVSTPGSIRQVSSGLKQPGAVPYLLTSPGDPHRTFLKLQALRVETLAVQPFESLLGQIGAIGPGIRAALDDLVLLRNLGRLRQRLGIHDAQAEG